MLRIFNWIVSISACIISFAYTFVLFNETKRLSAFQGNFVYLHLLLSCILLLVFAGYIIYFIRNNRRAIIFSRVAMILFAIMQIYRSIWFPINAEDLIIYSLSFCMLGVMSITTQKYFKLTTAKSSAT